MVSGGFIHLQKRTYAIERRNPYRKAFMTIRMILADNPFFLFVLVVKK